MLFISPCVLDARGFFCYNLCRCFAERKDLLFMRFWAKLLTFFLAMLNMPGTVSAAEDMRFVEAVGTTGYYVDVNSVAYEAYSLADARIAVKKADANRMYVYAMQFNRLKHTYRIYASQVIKYDTKEILESKDTGEAPRFYGPASPFNAVVDYLFTIGGTKVPPYVREIDEPSDNETADE